MNINEAFPSDYLKASDLGNKNPIVTIESVEMIDIGQGRDKEQKLLVRFVGKQKGLVCNKTNANTIGKLYGLETEGWIGKPIILMTREVEFAGEMVWAIRVSLQKPVSSVAPKPGAVTHGPMGKAHINQAEPEPESARSENDDIPF